jgi:hypothetical protein
MYVHERVESASKQTFSLRKSALIRIFVSLHGVTTMCMVFSTPRRVAAESMTNARLHLFICRSNARMQQLFDTK